MYLILFILGILIGSFLNVCIVRIPKKEDIVVTPSHCVHCGRRILWYDLLPVVSYLLLRGRCRQCHEKISLQYPLIELLNGTAYLGIFWFFGIGPWAILLSLLFSTLLVISLIDYNHKIIPNSTVVVVFFIGVMYTFFLSHNYINSMIGFFSVSIPLLIIHFITGGQMGMGDVKLMAAAGVFLGWQKSIVALLVGSVLGSVIGLILIAVKLIGRKEQIPFGPYLSIGIMVAALVGDSLIQVYFNLIL